MINPRRLIVVASIPFILMVLMMGTSLVLDMIPAAPCVVSESPDGQFHLESHTSLLVELVNGIIPAMPGDGGCSNDQGSIVLTHKNGSVLRKMRLSNIGTLNQIEWQNDHVSFVYFDEDVYSARWELPK